MSNSDDLLKQDSLYRNPRVIVLAIDAMLIMLGFGVVAPSMSYYLIALEGGLTQPPGPGYIVPADVVASFSLIFGVLMATFMGTRTLLARYWGGFSDTHGRRPVIVIGLFGYVLLMVFFGLAQNWIHLLLVRAFQGVVSAMVWPTAEAALMDIIGPERRGEGLGVYMMVSNLGFILGPGVGGLLYNFCRDFLLLPVPDVFRVPYFIGALIVLPATIITAIILKETAPGKIDLPMIDEKPSLVPEIPNPIETPIVEGPLKEMNLKTRRMINALYLMSMFNGVAMGLGQPIFQLFLMSRITTDIGLIGFIISGAGAVGLMFSIPAGRYSDRRGRKGLAVWGAVGSRITLGVLPLTTNLVQTSAVWIGQSATMSTSEPAMRAIQADIIPWNLRGKLFGTIQAFFNAGATIGPIAGGALFAYFSLILFPLGPLIIDGMVVPFWMASGLGLIGAYLLWKYVDETNPVKVVEIEEENPIKDAT
ncbi:MFS transporter [Candidatus Thorarchaeota archaeon]|nr:MAG: MFS transporter [Candidatus Thorarchaeota archaeon]